VNITATPTLVSLAPGDKLDRYELLCPIAEGGMASVWVARLRGKHGFEKLVAIKTILPKFAGDQRFRNMFLDEAGIASRIEHPNVAQIFDLGEERELLYLVMEYVDGDALSKLNRSCQKKDVKIPAGVVLRVLADACAGLHEAHELKDGAGRPMGIVHRDISPHNVLVSTKGIVKLIDFGIAKADSSETADAESGVLKGKIQYMAPEQALGRPVDRRADVWAVGAILYHMLAGKAPYEGDNQIATLHLLGSGVPPPPLPPDVHPAIAAVARKALQQEPTKRYGTAADLRDAMERAMVVAQLLTTSAEVSAFSTQHLAERAKRRRDAIERSLVAVAERVRMAGAKAAATLSGEVQSGSLDRSPASRSGGFASDAGAGARRPMDPSSSYPPPSQALQAPSRPTPRVSEPPFSASSYATLGSAALDASPPAGATKPRRQALTVLAFVFGFALVTGGSMTLLRPNRLSGAAPVAAAPGAMESGTHATGSSSLSAGAPSPSAAASTFPAVLPSASPKVDVLPAPRAAPERRVKKP
jgi:eukaryotic-like serine/threonine-protein kinase